MEGFVDLWGLRGATQEKGVQSARLFIMGKMLSGNVKKETCTLP